MTKTDRNDLARASDALAQARTDPAAARAEAETLLSTSSDAETLATARYALGMALRSQFELDEAVAILRQAARDAFDVGLTTLGGRAMLSLSGALAMAGDMTRAISAVERAREHLDGADLAAAQAQMATMLYEQDRHEEAVLEFNAAIATIGTHNALARLPLALANRANALAALGRLTEAQASLEQAWEVVDHDRAQTGMILSHLGWVAALRGDLPVALRWFEQLEQSDVPGRDDPGWLVDYAHALLESGLAEEAASAARQSLEMADKKGLGVRRQLPLRVLFDAYLQLGEVDSARATAEAAVEALEAIGGSVLPGRVRVLEAELAAQPRAEDLDRIESLIAEIEQTDRAAEALEARVGVALAAARMGAADHARANLPKRALFGASLRVQVQAWTALAFIRLEGADRVGAESALRAALRRADAHRAAFGAADVRAASAALGAEAANLGLRIAVEDGTPARVLAWVERARSAAQRTRPVLTRMDAQQRDLLTQYRQVSDRIRKDASRAPGLVRERTRLERRIRDHARTAGAEGQLITAIPSMAEVRRALGNCVFVELVESDGDMHALVIGPRRSDLTALPDAQGIEANLRSIDLALGRVLSDRGAAIAQSRIDRVLADLDERLIGPWRHLLDDEVVVSPTSLLHAVPWGALPSLRDRPVSVVPSVTAWMRERPTGSGIPVLVAGPDLDHAEPEIESLSKRWPNSSALIGDQATVGAVLEALAGASVAHVAAHGRFRTDNPMFTSLVLADGPLSLYDLEQLDDPPELVVLSACEAGSSVIRVGDELMGLAAAFLEIGSRSVIAPLFPVSDEATRVVMEIVHEHLAAGAAPAEALRSARASTDGLENLAAISFVCFDTAKSALTKHPGRETLR